MNFTINSYTPLKSEVKIKLVFSDPKNVSNGMETDQLEAVITEDIKIITDSYIAILK